MKFKIYFENIIYQMNYKIRLKRLISNPLNELDLITLSVDTETWKNLPNINLLSIKNDSFLG